MNTSQLRSVYFFELHYPEDDSASIKADTSKLQGVTETWYKDISENQFKLVAKEKELLVNKIWLGASGTNKFSYLTFVWWWHDFKDWEDRANISFWLMLFKHFRFHKIHLVFLRHLKWNCNVILVIPPFQWFQPQQ